MLFKLVSRAFVITWVVFRFGIPALFQRSRRPEYARRAFERLGPTYIKFGQIIASSPGLFPPPWVEEFQRCLDRVPAFPFAEVQRIIEEETGQPLAEAFESVDETPIAAASIAQVHAARLSDGTDVVIKVQRPKIRERVDADLWFMRQQAWIAEKISLDMRLANVTGVVADFGDTLAEELDFRTEGRNMDEFNAIMAQHGEAGRIRAPHVYWERTTARLLTMERFHGFKADDVDEAHRRGFDTEQWLRIGVRGWNMTMMLHGCFHGDVHAGNLMFMPDDNCIGFIDFGIVGRFTPTQRMQVLRYVLSFAIADFEELARVMVEMDAGMEEVDIPELGRDLERVYSPLLSTSLSDLDYGAILPDITANARKHGLRMPREFILILKQLLYFDRYAKLAAPNLNVLNDLYLFDFLFTPAAAESGIPMQEVGQLLLALQAKMTAQAGGSPTAQPAASSGAQPSASTGAQQSASQAISGPASTPRSADSKRDEGAPKKRVKIRVKPRG